MTSPTDAKKLTDAPRPFGADKVTELAKAKVEQATKSLEQHPLGDKSVSPGADQVKSLADGPVDSDDWMTLHADRFTPGTKDALAGKGLTADQVLGDSDKAEAYAGEALLREGLPDGNGGTEKVRGVTAGHFDGKHGIDLVAASRDGKPIPIEVKKYGQPSAAALEDRGVTELEPEVEAWRKERQSQVSAYQHGRLADVRADAKATWKPEVQQWRGGLRDASHKMTRNDQGKPYLPIQQMDDLWTRDRWLKLTKTPEGQQRMQDIGVSDRYLDHGRLKSSPDLPEWHEILDQRTAVIVSSREGGAGRRLFDQAVFEKRAKRVIKIAI